MNTIIYWTSLITNEFSLGVVIFLISLVFWVRGRKKEALELSLGTLFAVLISFGLKHLLQIPRPEHPLIIISGYGFPSSHATFITFVACMLYVFLVRSMVSKVKRIESELLLLFIVLLISLSRIIYQVHTLYDVIGGIGIGALTAIGMVHLVKRYSSPRV